MHPSRAALVFAATLGLAACGGGTGTEGAASPATQNKPQAAAEATVGVAVANTTVTPVVDPATARAKPASYAGLFGSFQNAFGAVTGTLGNSGSLALNGPPTAPVSVQRAVCGPGSNPETGLQGQVPLADRQNGRNLQGYSCNLELVGQYQGEGSDVISDTFGTCAYMPTSVFGIPFKKSQGVQVVDASNPAQPRLSTTLTSPAMAIGTWESLRVNERRGLLAGVGVGVLAGGATLDVYDIADNCAKPKLLNGVLGTKLTLPATVLAHEGNWSPDGMTYWSSGVAGGSLTAVDMRDPKAPRIVFTGTSVVVNHGFSLSEDGNRMYLSTAFPAGMVILDVSDVQSRKPVPIVRQVGSVFWNAGGVSQNTLSVTYGGKPYLFVTDEFASEAVKLIDISDETKPKIANRIQLEIHLPQHVEERKKDTSRNGLYGYEAHYCTVDRKNDPTAMACGYFQSGVRVLDVRDPFKVKEIAYYNPPAQQGKAAQLPGSVHATQLVNGISGLPITDAINLNLGTPVSALTQPQLLPDLSADWCGSPPRFVGNDMLRVVCTDNGVLTLKFRNGVYPVR